MAESGLGHAYVNQVSADLVFTSRLTSLAPQHVCIQYRWGDPMTKNTLEPGQTEAPLRSGFAP